MISGRRAACREERLGHNFGKEIVPKCNNIQWRVSQDILIYLTRVGPVLSHVKFLAFFFFLQGDRAGEQWKIGSRERTGARSDIRSINRGCGSKREWRAAKKTDKINNLKKKTLWVLSLMKKRRQYGINYQNSKRFRCVSRYTNAWQSICHGHFRFISSSKTILQ